MKKKTKKERQTLKKLKQLTIAVEPSARKGGGDHGTLKKNPCLGDDDDHHHEGIVARRMQTAATERAVSVGGEVGISTRTLL